PAANFQVLVEPDGHTGSYVLFDKQTLQPLALVDTAALKYSIKDGLLTVGNSSLTQAQKDLIADAFKSYFADSTTTKSLTNFTDSVNPFINGQTTLLKNGATATIVTSNTNNNGVTGPTTTQASASPGSFQTDPGPPKLASFDLHAVATTSFASGEKPGVT